MLIVLDNRKLSIDEKLLGILDNVEDDVTTGTTDNPPTEDPSDEPVTPPEDINPTDPPEEPKEEEPEINVRESFSQFEVNKIEDIYASVQEGERIVFVTRHAARGSDTSITGDLSSTGINQCKTVGTTLKNINNTNIDLSKSYIGGSYKYRAKNTAYQATKAMGVVYPDDYNYLDADSYSELMEINFFMDENGESSTIDMDVNAYYCYISENGYTGPNKVENHVDTKSQELIDLLVGVANTKDVDLAWFGTHDKVIQPLMAYVTNRKNPIHIVRSNKDGYVKLKPLPYDGYVGNWSIPLLSGLAIIINKEKGTYEIYPIECGF